MSSKRVLDRAAIAWRTTPPRDCVDWVASTALISSSVHRVHADHVGISASITPDEAGAAEAFVVFRPADDAVSR